MRSYSQIHMVVAPNDILEQGLWEEWVKVIKSINVSTVFTLLPFM